MNTRSRRDERGFTLLELLVVIAILGLLIGLVAPAALRQLGSARTSVARQSIERISSILDIYKLDVGSYPSTDQGLRALVEQPTGRFDLERAVCEERRAGRSVESSVCIPGALQPGGARFRSVLERTVRKWRQRHDLQSMKVPAAVIRR